MNYTQLSKLENQILTKSKSLIEYMSATYAMAAACERLYPYTSYEEHLRVNGVHHEINENRARVEFGHDGEGITWV